MTDIKRSILNLVSVPYPKFMKKKDIPVCPLPDPELCECGELVYYGYPLKKGETRMCAKCKFGISNEEAIRRTDGDHPSKIRFQCPDSI